MVIVLMNAHRERLGDISNEYIVKEFIKSGNRKLDFKVLELVKDYDYDQGSFYLLFQNTSKKISLMLILTSVRYFMNFQLLLYRMIYLFFKKTLIWQFLIKHISKDLWNLKNRIHLKRPFRK